MSSIWPPSASARQTAMTTVITLIIGAVGAIAGWAINMPLAYLAGPALAVAIAGVAGVKTDIAHPLREVGFLLVGLTVGSMVSPDSIGAMIRWPIAFSLLALLTVVTPFIGRTLLPRTMGINRNEAFFSTAPGHLSLVIAMIDSMGISTTRPVVIASVRVLAITLLVPIAARLAGLDIGTSLPETRETAPWMMLAAQLIAAVLLSPLLNKLRFPAPTLLAAMIVAGSAHLSGVIHGSLPLPLSEATLVMMGALIGTRFSGTPLRSLLGALGAGIFVVALTSGLAIAFAIPAAWISGLPLLDMLVAFAPGGLETMVIVGAAVGADPSFVAAAHVTRLLILAVVIATYATKISHNDPPE